MYARIACHNMLSSVPWHQSMSFCIKRALRTLHWNKKFAAIQKTKTLQRTAENACFNRIFVTDMQNKKKVRIFLRAHMHDVDKRKVFLFFYISAKKYPAIVFIRYFLLLFATFFTRLPTVLVQCTCPNPTSVSWMKSVRVCTQSKAKA